jgi:hypothetical protein
MSNLFSFSFLLVGRVSIPEDSASSKRGCGEVSGWARGKANGAHNNTRIEKTEQAAGHVVRHAKSRRGCE